MPQQSDKDTPFNVKYGPKRRIPPDINDPVPYGGEYREDNPATVDPYKAKMDRSFSQERSYQYDPAFDATPIKKNSTKQRMFKKKY